VTKDIIRKIHKLLFEFVWNGKDKVKRPVLIQDFSEGGLRMPDLESLIKTQTIMYVKRCLENSFSTWKVFLHHYIEKIGGCFIFNFSKLSLNIPQFYKECLEPFSSLNSSDISTPGDILKQSMDVLAGPITDIANSSLVTGVFPTTFKKGIICPLIKKHSLDHDEFSSYRPITNIAFPSKVLERVSATQTMNYLLENNLLAKFQSAYRLFHSTETALVRLFNDILLAIDRHQDTYLVLLDLSAAFDTIDHTVLLERLQHRYGIKGTTKVVLLVSSLEDAITSHGIDCNNNNNKV
jgi:hypothetical protein